MRRFPFGARPRGARGLIGAHRHRGPAPQPMPPKKRLGTDFSGGDDGGGGGRDRGGDRGGGAQEAEQAAGQRGRA